MAKNLASVKPVKCYVVLENGKIDVKNATHQKIVKDDIECTVITTPRYKKLMDVVKEAVAWKDGDYRNENRLREAIKAAEKAGAL